MMPVEMLKLALVEPATVTDAGAVNSGDALFDNITTVPVGGAATDSVTVHPVPPFVLRVVMAQVSPVTPGTITLAVPPLAVSGKAAAVAEALTVFPTPIDAGVAEASVTVAVATTPLGITSAV